MITRASHMTVYVLDQDRARDFYVNKLDFEVRQDAPFGEDMRWLTVGPRDQPDLEIILMPAQGGSVKDEESAQKLAELVQSGTFGFGVFKCDDIYATYEELKARGVEFVKEPTEEFYGIEALFKDDSGNWFSLGQKE